MPIWGGICLWWGVFDHWKEFLCNSQIPTPWCSTWMILCISQMLLLHSSLQLAARPATKHQHQERAARRSVIPHIFTIPSSDSRGVQTCPRTANTLPPLNHNFLIIHPAPCLYATFKHVYLHFDINRISFSYIKVDSVLFSMSSSQWTLWLLLIKVAITIDEKKKTSGWIIY